MLITTIKHTIVYSFYGLSAFAASFFASLLGRFEYQHPAWISLGSLALSNAIIITLAILIALTRAQIIHNRPTYRAAI